MKPTLASWPFLLFLACAPVLADGPPAPSAPAAPVSGEDAPRTAESWVLAMQEAFFAAGKDMRATVRMSLVHPSGSKRERILSMVRVDLEDAGEQRYFLHFSKPADVRNTAFLVWRHPGINDDRWIYMPALNLVRRIAAEDSRSSFVGSDFTYEDISGRDLEQDEHALEGPEDLDGRPSMKVVSRPRERADYAYVRTWIDAENHLPLRQDFVDAADKVVRRFTVDEVRTVPGAGDSAWPTAVRRTMEDLATGHRTVVVFEDVVYDQGIRAEDMTEDALRRPPREWVGR